MTTGNAAQLSSHNVLTAIISVRIKQATDWILSLSSSPGCNVLGALRLALQHRKHIDEITLVMGGRLV